MSDDQRDEHRSETLAEAERYEIGTRRTREKLARAKPLGPDSVLSFEVSRVTATCSAATTDDLYPFEIGCH